MYIYTCFCRSHSFVLHYPQEPNEVFSNSKGFRIYIGNAFHAQDVAILQQKGITYVVNMAARHCQTGEDFYGDGIQCLMIYAEDIEEYDLSQHFSEVSEFMDTAHENNAGVLVHCMAGVSRSVTVTIAYLMKW